MQAARLTAPALAALAALTLSGCAGIFGEQDTFAVPRPFAGENRFAPTVMAVKTSRTIALKNVDGLDEQSTQSLGGAILRLADEHDVLAVPTESEHFYALRGLADFSPPQGGEQGVTLDWEVLDPEGRLVSSFKVGSSWMATEAQGHALPEGVATALATQTLDELAKALTPVPEKVAASAQTPADNRLALALLPVVGAPGDGAKSLASAMNAILAADERIRLVKEPGENVLLLDARVVMSALSTPGRERIDIEWRLRAPDGRVLGTLKQANDIAKGSLNGSWGPTALDIANATASGLYDLLRQVSRKG
ncbi:MAG: hypothetical protein HXY22_03830 [Alphaproteobacteria bacterium]|nr:hypothetical protein [Alphaproteobacteria bacterium]